MAKILVVDDDPNSLELVELALERGQHTTVLCQQPEQAVETAVAERVEAAVLDIMMPGMSGFDVLQAMQGNVFTRGIPVLFLSALGDPPDRVRGLREGACDYVAKPFDADELLVRVEKLLAMAARSGSLLQGSLQSFHLADILQQVAASKNSGTLDIRTGSASGSIVLNRGVLEAAEYSGLEGPDAVLAMLEANRGEFCFTANDGGEPGPPPAGPGIALHTVLMEAAWLTDELERVRDAMPGSRDELEVAGRGLPEIPSELDGAGVEQVYRTLEEHGPLPLGDLQLRVGLAPQKVLLATCWMIDQEALVVRTNDLGGEADGHARASLGSELEALVDHVLASASARGFSDRVAHVLLAAQPDQWEALGTLVQGMPSEIFTTEPMTFVGEVEQRSSGTLRIAVPSGTVLVHVYILTEMSALRVQTVVPRCAAVVLWTGDPSPDSESGDIVDLVERQPGRTLGLLIPSGARQLEAWAEAIRGGEKWQVVDSTPASVTELLAKL